MSIGVIIYLEGLSVRHPKGARSIGIGHPRSGDRCTMTLPYPLDPLRVTGKEDFCSATRKGSRGINHALYIGLRHYVARPMPMERASLRMPVC